MADDSKYGLDGTHGIKSLNERSMVHAVRADHIIQTHIAVIRSELDIAKLTGQPPNLERYLENLWKALETFRRAKDTHALMRLNKADEGEDDDSDS